MKGQLKLQKAPNPLPDELNQAASQLVSAWINHPARPRIQGAIALRWHDTIMRWANDAAEMPLLLRKSAPQWGGHVKVHPRRPAGIAHCDNSPAQWVMRRCLEESYLGRNALEYGELLGLVKNREFPLNMVMDRDGKENPDCLFKKGLRQKEGISAQLKYHTAHIVDVGLADKTPVEEIEIGSLVLHFIRLMSPINMLLVPLQLEGIADLECFRAEALSANSRDFGPAPIADLQPVQAAPPTLIPKRSINSPDA